MIVGLGIDLVEIARMGQSLSRHEGALKTRVFTAAEREYCEQQARPEVHYAARFAAKEAFSKALGTGIGEDASWQEIEVVSDSRGKPALVVTGAARARMQALGGEGVHVSLTHTESTAGAVVVIEAPA